MQQPTAFIRYNAIIHYVSGRCVLPRTHARLAATRDLDVTAVNFTETNFTVTYYQRLPANNTVTHFVMRISVLSSANLARA